jgi:hypothetical protein
MNFERLVPVPQQGPSSDIGCQKLEDAKVYNVDSRPLLAPFILAAWAARASQTRRNLPKTGSF